MLNWDDAFAGGKKFTVINEIFLDTLLEDLLLIRKGKKIKNALDIGCGAGDFAIKIAKKNIRVTGIDFSKVAIQMAKDFAKINKVSQKTDFIEFNIEDLAELPLKKMYDLITCKLVVAFIKNKKVFLAEVYNRLNPDGVFILMTPIIVEGASNHLKAISVSREEIEKLLKNQFKSFIMYHTRYFEDRGVELTYILKK
ncbi:MAG: class I SAM-dependent methyltransferase [Patescibacteria group bacterium]